MSTIPSDYGIGEEQSASPDPRPQPPAKDDQWAAINARRQVLGDPELKAGPKALYMYLLEFSYERRWQFWRPGSILISIGALAKGLNAAERSITAWTKKLLDRGVIWVSVQHYRNMWDQNVYHITALRPRGVSPQVPESVYAGGGVEGNESFRGKFCQRSFLGKNAECASETADFTTAGATNSSASVAQSDGGASSKEPTHGGTKVLRAVGKIAHRASSQGPTGSSKKASPSAPKTAHGHGAKPANYSKGLGQGEGLSIRGEGAPAPPKETFRGGDKGVAVENWAKATRLSTLFRRELEPIKADLVKALRDIKANPKSYDLSGAPLKPQKAEWIEFAGREIKRLEASAKPQELTRARELRGQCKEILADPASYAGVVLTRSAAEQAELMREKIARISQCLEGTEA